MASTGATRVIDGVEGSDSNPGSESAPWRTLRRAFAALAPGEIALVRNGSYSGRIDPTGSASGTASAPKTLAAYPGHAPVFTSLIRADGLQYWRFRGLTFAPIGLDTGFYAVASTANLDFENVTFRDCPLGSGIVTETSCSNIQWWRCTFRNNGRSAAAGGMYDHGLYLKSKDCVVADSVFARNSSCAIHLYNGGPVNAIVVNNTIVENGIRSANTAWSAGVLLGTDGGVNAANNNKILNNVVAFNTGWGAKSNSNVRAGANNLFRRNLVFGNSLGATSWTSGGVTESETLNVDPMFVDRANGNYRLAAGSPAIDGSLLEYAPATDHFGATRA
ncbi:MAG: right-handed parallel beta-helix repeat-containing protein [Actinomycetota bacterium]|nr:right-handed parallel beta-helix repeat-containing protein [Actinomycetota bacterium]